MSQPTLNTHSASRAHLARPRPLVRSRPRDPAAPLSCTHFTISNQQSPSCWSTSPDFPVADEIGRSSVRLNATYRAVTPAASPTESRPTPIQPLLVRRTQGAYPKGRGWINLPRGFHALRLSEAKAKCESGGLLIGRAHGRFGRHGRRSGARDFLPSRRIDRWKSERAPAHPRIKRASTPHPRSTTRPRPPSFSSADRFGARSTHIRSG